MHACNICMFILSTNRIASYLLTTPSPPPPPPSAALPPLFEFAAAAVKKPSASERTNLQKDLRKKIGQAGETRQTKAKPKKKKKK